MLEGLEILDVITVLALSLVVVSLALAWATRMAWRLMCNLRDEEVEHAHTRRRLDDVEHLRRRETATRNEAIMNAAMCPPPLDPRTFLDSDRATDRAYAEAGIMPVADYVAKHGEEPRQ